MTTKAEARNHHWIPQCYLKGFAKSRSKNAKLFVADAISRKTFETIPRNVASARDFNRIDVPGVPPNQIESDYARFEGLVDKALERMAISKEFGDDEAYNLILNLIALLAVRNPRMREHSQEFQERIIKRMMELTVATKEHYEASLGTPVRGDVVESDQAVTYEAMRDFVERDEYTIEVSTTGHVRQELELVDTVLPLLGKRHWLLIRAPANSGGFITSDDPVVLVWSERKNRGPFSSPGFGLRDTEVIFTVTRDLAMLGVFDGEVGVREARPETVAQINGIIVAHSNRQIYARDDRFRYALASGEIRRGADILSNLVNPK